jgi:hypothetical protein
MASEQYISQVQIIAAEFCRVLATYLTPVELGKAIAANKLETDANVCHSHDYCDANMAMWEAMVNTGIIDDNGIPEPSTKEQVLWNDSWELAVLAEFDVDSEVL